MNTTSTVPVLAEQPPKKSITPKLLVIVTSLHSEVAVADANQAAICASKLASPQSIVNGAGHSIVGAFGPVTGITLSNTTAGLSQLLAEATVHVTVTSPPHSSKLLEITPGVVPLISQAAVSPLLYVAIGAVNAAASTQDKLAGKLGSSIEGSGAGATSIVTDSTTAGLSQLSLDGTVHVIVIVPPHSSKSASTVLGTVPLIAHDPVSPLLYVASGATKLAASPHVTSAIAGTSITGSGAGATSIVTDSTTAGLSQLSADGTVHVTVIVPPHSSKLSFTVAGTVPLIAHAPVSPLL